PFQLNVRSEAKSQRIRNLKCNSSELAQINFLAGCNAGFIHTAPDFKVALKSVGTVGDKLNVNIDYDQQREFDASNVFSLSYRGGVADHLQRVELGNISVSLPASRFITSTMPSSNYGLQVTNQFGRMKFRSIFAQENGNVVLRREYRMGAHPQQ